MTDLEGRILNPVVMLTMLAAGVGYARILWSINLRPTGVLWVTAVAPGAIFLVTFWMIRAMQGRPSLIWPYLLIEWLIFSGTAVLLVLYARRRHRA